MKLSHESEKAFTAKGATDAKENQGKTAAQFNSDVVLLSSFFFFLSFASLATFAVNAFPGST